MYKTDHSAVFYRTAEDFYEFAMAHGVEEAFKVKVYYIGVALVDYPLRSSYCVMASSSRTEAVARLGELVLIDWSQYLVYGLLHQTVYYCRYLGQHLPQFRFYINIKVINWQQYYLFDSTLLLNISFGTEFLTKASL